MESLRLVDDCTSSFTSIADVIRHDQSISAKIISIANSAFYSRGVPILTLQRAMIAVGLEQTKQIIACIIFVNGVLKNVGLSRNVSVHLTRHSLLVTYTAQRLAQKTLSVDPDKAFIAGLIHDIGKVVFCLCDHSYLSVAEQVVAIGADLCAFERDVYGIDHQETGHCLSTKWRFPGELKEVVNQHHGSGRDAQPLTRIARAAEAYWTRPEDEGAMEAVALLPDRQDIEQQVESIVGQW